MPCALRKLDWVELLVPIEISRLYAEKLCEFKVELKLEKLCDADGVVCTHGEVGGLWGESGRWLGAREKWFHFFFRKASSPKNLAEMARTKRAARMATGMRAPRIGITSYKEFSETKRNSSGRTYEPVDDQLVLYGKFTPQHLHPRDFVLVTHSYAPERFWVQIVKHKDGIIWGIVDNSLIFVDWPQGKKIRFSICRVFDVYAGEA